MTDVRYGCPVEHWRGNIGITFYGSCTYAGRSTWGYRLTCDGCGADQSCPVGSSVSHEDAPHYFAREHRACNAAARADMVRVELRKPVRSGSPLVRFLYCAGVSDADALALAAENLHAAWGEDWTIVGASRDY